MFEKFVQMSENEAKSRRVSFAATAHVRLFEKEEQEVDIEEQELQKTLEMFHPTKKDFDLSIHEEYHLLTSKSSFDIDVQGSSLLDVKTPTKPVPSPFKLTAVSSATPTLDRAIQESAKKFKTPDLFNTSLQSPGNLSVFDNNDSLEMSPIVALKKTESLMDVDQTTPSKEDSVLNFTTPENVVTTPTSRPSSLKKTPSVLKESHFPKLTPQILTPMAQETKQATPSALGLLASSKKYRDSIAQFFKNTPKRSSNLRQSVVSMDQDSDTSSILVGTESPFARAAEDFDPTPKKMQENVPPSSVKSAPGSVIRESKRPRDSIAPFFSHVPKTSKPRDSIAPFFAMNTEDSEAESMVLEETQMTQDMQLDETNYDSIDLDVELESIKEKVAANQAAVKKSKPRDSIAPFFAMNDTMQDESLALDMSQDLTETAKELFEVKVQEEMPSMDEELNVEQDMSMEESMEFSIAPEMTSTPTKESRTPLKFQGISPVVEKKASPRSSPRRTSTRAASAPTSPVAKSSPRKKTKEDGIATPMRPAVTPMRRAVAQKALQSATKSTTKKSATKPPKTQSPRKTPLVKERKQDPESPTDSPARRSARKRKSIGGGLLQTLEEVQKEFGDGAVNNDMDDVEIPESPFAKKFKDIEAQEKRESVEESVTPSQEEVVASEDSLLHNEEPLDQMLEPEQMDSFLAEDFGTCSSIHVDGAAEAEPIAANGETDDLMNETHLSIMNSSIVEESLIKEPSMQEIKTLDEFLVTTGIEFLPTKILPSEKKIVESGQLEDQVRVYQEECYVHGCDELEKTIEQLQTTINGFRQDMDENPPLLFDEFAQGTILEREEIVSNLNRSKEYCLLEARADWYPWKQMLFDRMFKNLDVHYEKLEQDYQVVAPLLEQFKQVGVAAKGYLDEVVTNIDIVQQEYEAKVEELAQAKVLLTTEKEERRLRMAEIKAQLELIEQQTKEADQQLLELERSSLEYSLRIDQAEKMCAELVVFDPADLASVRGDYHITTLTHLWRPAELLPSKQTWIFDDAIQISFTQQGNLYFSSTRLYTPFESEHKETIIKAKRSTQNSDIIMDVGEERIDEMLRVFDKHHQHVTDVAFMKRVFHDVASFWESIKTIHRDMKKSNHFTSSRVEWVGLKKTEFVIQTSFLSEEKKCVVDTKFEFSCVNGVPLYPFGKVCCDAVAVIGDVDVETIQSSVLELNNGPDYAVRCCQLVRQLVGE